jgi:hypothetical protein
LGNLLVITCCRPSLVARRRPLEPTDDNAAKAILFGPIEELAVAAVLPADEGLPPLAACELTMLIVVKLGVVVDGRSGWMFGTCALCGLR